MDKCLTSTSKDDASPLTTSTESETFDTWTLITDKAKIEDISSDAFTPLTPEKSDDDGDNADETVHVDAIKESEELADNRYNDMDDISDGISIISESESAGRVSPHPELRKRLPELNMRFINVPESTPASTTEGCQALNYDACSERSSDTFHRVEPLLESNRRPRRSSRQMTESTDIIPTIQGGLRGLFYVGALLAVIAFISKLKYDAWESVLGTRTGLLTQKINELELNSNLMRAEIDILSKQVKYLTTLSENLKSTSTFNKPKNSQTRENTFKAWPGHGNKIEEVTITPEDLKIPFTCDGLNNVDQNCIDAQNSKDTNEDKTTKDNQKNDFPKSIDEIMETIVKVAENPYIEISNNPTQTEELPIEQPAKNDYAPHEHQAGGKPDQYNNKKYEKRDNHKKHSKNHSGESKENDRSRRDRSSEEKDSSAELFKKLKDYKKNEKRMSAEYEKAKREADGYWHEKMMQHRENSRKNNEKQRRHDKNDKNWYIERGDSREQARYDHKHRGNGQR